MNDISMLAMIKSGVYFGHRKRWLPAFAPYLYGTREGIHIINLRKHSPCLRRPCLSLHKRPTTKVKFWWLAQSAAQELVKKTCRRMWYAVCR